MDKAAGLGVITVDESTFDGEKTISVSPTWLASDEKSWGANSVKLGARWSSNAPEFVALIMQYSSNTSGYSDTYLGLESKDINLEGEITSFEASRPTDLDNSAYNSASRTIYTSSTNTVVLPMNLLQKMVSSSDCRIRIHTSEGYEDSIFSLERTGGGARTALLAIQEFLQTIELSRANG